MAEVGRRLWRLSVHPHIHREVTCSTFPRITQFDFKYFCEWRNGKKTLSLGHLFQCLTILRGKSFLVLTCGHWFFSLHRTPLWKVCLLLHYSPNIYIYWQDPLSCLLFLRLNSPRTVSLPFKADTPLVISIALHWICFSMSPSLLYQEPHNWTQNSRCVSPKLSKEEESPVTICWQCSSWCSPRHCWVYFCMCTLLAHVQLGKQWSQRARELHPIPWVPTECQDRDCSRLDQASNWSFLHTQTSALLPAVSTFLCSTNHKSPLYTGWGFTVYWLSSCRSARSKSIQT